MICPPEPEQTCQLDHEHLHGQSWECYKKGRCRCADCRARNATYARNRKKQMVYGRWDTNMVAAAPVREHIRMLQSHGFGVARIAEVSGAPVAAVNRVAFRAPYTGKLTRTIKRSTAEKILAVQPSVDDLADHARISAHGTHRRIQALVYMGWNMTYISRRLGMDKWNFGKLMHHETVRVHTFRAMRDLYEELWDEQPQPRTRNDAEVVRRTKKLARDRGWLSPLAWDEIDDPNEQPKGLPAFAYTEQVKQEAA